MSYRIARYGWVPDLPDQRDHLYAAPVEWLAVLPARVDLCPQCPPVYDQGPLGSCTANAIAAAIEFDRLKQKLSDFVPSRLFIYYNERVIEHTADFDSGAQIRDGIKSVARQGDCPESEWPYVIARFKTRPPARCYADALPYRVVLYQRLTPVLSQLKGCLASGYPFVFGFTVYESFESARVAKTGHASLPGAGERAIGGHAVMGVGYNDARQWFVIRNSWGARWGLKGYFTLPYAYLTDENLATDFWTIRIVQ
ncbi:MAG TPA: C1 family peptidase [Candidatus Acidoferrum sp.]|nr:C1 family peptidase [Candidatus Acidoferrum sp.]